MAEGDVVVDVDLLFREQGATEIAQRAQRAAERASVSFSRIASAQASVTSQMRQTASATNRVAAGLTKAGSEALNLAKAFQSVQLGQDVIVQGLRNLQSEISKSRTLQRQAVIDQRLTADRARQAEIESARAANARLNIEAQRSAQSQLIRQRQAGQQRIQITRAVFENLGRLERAFGASIAGIARTATGAIGRSFDALTRQVRITNRSFTEGTQTSLSRREQLIRGSFSRQERILAETVTRQQRTVEKLNRTLSTGVAGAVTGRGLGAGIAGVGGGLGVAGLITSGFQRFSDLERINKQFLALTGSIEQTDLLLEQVKEFAKETPFDLVGVADLAKGFLAIGTATEDVIPRVTAIADAVALTGGGVEELNRIQRAIGQVVSAGRLQGDELNQLAENLPGLNLRQILADQITGGNVRELVEMQAAGEITADLFVDGLINGLATDERLVGASQDLAETLGGRVANLKESFADFGASIIGVIAEPLKEAVLISQTTLQSLADFVKGEVGPALQVLRTFLGGVASGLGTIVAARGAIQVLSLLARVATLAATPFGLLVTSAGLIGGVLAVLAKNFPEVGAAIRDVGATIAELASGPLGILRDALSTVLNFFVSDQTRLIAAVGDDISYSMVRAADATSGFQDFITEKFIPALRRVSEFVQTTFGPVVTAIGRFIADTVVPAAVEAGRVLAEAFETARQTVIEFAERALPFLEQIAERARSAGEAILEVVGGSRLLLAAGAGIAGFAVGGPIGAVLAALASLADKILPALRPVGEQVLGFFRDLFTRDNLLDVGAGALQIVETIGFALGNLVSDPRFVAAIGGVVAAATLAAVRFAEGFARGVADNLPQLLDLSLDGIKAGLGALVAEVLFDPQVLAAAVGAALVAPALIRRFRGFGEEASQSFAQGFRSQISSTGGFLQGLFGGSSGVRSAATSRELTQLFNDAAREANRLQGTLTSFGSSTQIAAIDGVIPSSERLAAARAEVERLTAGLSNAEIQGVRLRSAIGRTFETIGTAARGVGAGIREVGAAFGRSFSAPLANASAAIFDLLSRGTQFEDVYRRGGASAGQAFEQNFGQRVRTGAAGIADAFRSGISGLRQIAAEQGTTIGRVLGSQVASGAAIALGGFVAGRAEGQSGGSGLLSALGAGLTGVALGGPVVGAAAAGLALVGTAFGATQRAADEARAAAEAFAGALKSDLKTALKDTTDGAVDFAEALSGASQSQLGAAIVEALGPVLPLLDDLGIKQQEVIDAFINGGDAFDELIRRIGGAQLGSSRSGGFFDVDFNPFNEPNTEAIFENQEAVDALVATYAALAEAIELVNAERSFTGSDPVLNAEGETRAAIDAQRRAWEEAQRAADEYGVTLGTPVEARFTDAMEAALDDARVKADEVSDAIDRIFGQRDATSLAASFDAAVLSVAGSFDGLVVGGGIIDQASLDTALNDLKADLSAVAKAGLNEGVVYDEATLRSQTLGILGAALDGVDDPALRDAIATAYEEGIAAAVPVIDAQNIFDQLAAGLAEEELSVPVELDGRALSGSAGQLRQDASTLGRQTADSYAAGLESGIRAKAAAVARAAIGVVQNMKERVDDALGIKSPSRVAALQGQFYGEGFAIGVLNTSSVSAQAAQQLALAATAGLGAGAQGGPAVDSAREAGRSIGKAIADGLADTEADMASVVSRAVDDALGNLSSLGSPIRNATATAAAQLFAGLTGSQNAFEDRSGPLFSGLQAGITSSLQGFLGTFDSNVARIFEVNAKKLADLNAQEREIFGTDVFSLDARTVFGASNFSAISGFLEQVASLGEELIAKGAPLDEVSKTLQGYIDDLVDTAANLGFNRDQLEALVASLGLSDEAIAAFIAQVDELNRTSALPGTPPARDGDEEQERGPQSLPRVQQTFVVNLPTGDPYAAALTIANQQAQAAELP